MKLLKFQLFNPKKDIRALIIFGVLLIPILVNINYLLNNKEEENLESNISVSEKSYEELDQVEVTKDILSDYIDGFLSDNPDITYQEALDFLIQNINMPTNIMTPSRIKPLLRIKMGVEDNPILIYSISGDKSLKIVNGNIFLTNKEEREKQITFEGLNTEAIFSPDETKIALIREDTERMTCFLDGCLLGNEIWLYDIEKEEETMLLRGRYKKEEEGVTKIHNLTFLLNDNENIYFMCGGWVTSDAIHKLNILTKETKFITDGNSLEPINKGDYEGNMFTLKHKYFRSGGAYDIYFVVNSEGKELLAVASEEDFYNGNFFQTSKQDRDNFLNYVKNEFSDIEYPESDIKGVKRIIEKDEDEGERIFYYLTYPEIEGEEVLSSSGALGWSFSYWVGDFDKPIIKNNFFDGSVLSNDYEITLLKGPLLSIRFDFYEYSASAAHGIYTTEVFNFKTCGGACKGEFIELKDIFNPDSDYLAVLSEISQKKIAEKFKENGDYENFYFNDLVKGGTSPESGNLDKFNLSEDALIITFDPYEVASFNFGKQVVEIPYEELEEYLDFNGIIKDLIKK